MRVRLRVRTNCYLFRSQLRLDVIWTHLGGSSFISNVWWWGPVIWMIESVVAFLVYLNVPAECRNSGLAGINRGLRTQVCIYLHESIKSVQYERNISPFIHPINLTINNPSILLSQILPFGRKKTLNIMVVYIRTCPFRSYLAVGWDSSDVVQS